MARWYDILNRFRSDERGNIALLFGLSLVPLVGAAGVAVDHSKASNVQTALQTEVDATALEAAKAAVEVHTDPANATKTAAQKQALIDAKLVSVLAQRTTIAQARSAMTDNSLVYTGDWVDALKTEYKVTARVNVKRYVRVLADQAYTPVSVAATARMQYNAVVTTTTPTMTNPGYEAGDYNRIYAYCYNKNEPVVANRRTKMTAISSNGTDGGVPEMTTNPVFQNIVMPVCDADAGETLSWRLYNVRGQRTNKSKWPNDSSQYNPPTDYTPASDKGGVTIYNHYSDTTVDPVSGVESYQFRGDAFNFYAPIEMMETFVCDTQAACTPGASGSTIPSQSAAPYNMPKNRNPTQSSTKCEPGKFMYIGWEDRPFLPKTNAADYSTNNSHQWTDSDYDDIRLVISCPSTTITGYTKKISLIK
ncbi:MAG: TadE/TadG family type IV pilus assembly protein [Beijerinckiaceae bacterium]